MLNFEDEMTVRTKDDQRAEKDDAMRDVEYQLLGASVGIV